MSPEDRIRITHMRDACLSEHDAVLIPYGRKHFGLSQEVVFKDVSRLEGLVQ